MFEEATEALRASKDARCGPRSGSQRLVPEPLVRPLLVVVLQVFANRRRNDASPKNIIRFKHSDLIDSTKRSACALQFGARRGVKRTFTPTTWRMCRNSVVNFVSRSQITNRCARRNPSSGSVRFLATCAMKAPSGLVVRPAMCARRVLRSMRNRT